MKNTTMTGSLFRLLSLVALLLIPCLSFADEPLPIKGEHDALDFKPGEIIVKFKEGAPETSINSVLLAEKMSVLKEWGEVGIMLLSVPEGQEMEMIERLKRNPLVEYAEPNYIFRITSPIVIESPHALSSTTSVIPDDPYLQWNLAKIEAHAAWDITTGSDRVVIAVISTGVDLDHPELKDKIWTNKGEIPDNGLDDDGNGYKDDVHGWDFINWNGEPEDDVWHGTYISSIAAAETNNGVLIAGVSWGAEIMPIKVMELLYQDQEPVLYMILEDLNGGILYAADNGAKIIDLGIQLSGYDYPHSVQNVIDYAYSKGALVVAGSGDLLENSPPPDVYRYPAALEHVVSVAATGQDDELCDISCYNDKVDVAAPGCGGVWGVYIHPNCSKSVAASNSTWGAAAHVSGLAALIWSVNPHLTNDQVEEIIESTAVDLGEPGWDEYFGWGRIDAAAAVMATTHYLEVEPANVVDLGRVCDHGVLPKWTIINPNTNASTWHVMPTDEWLSVSGPYGLTPSSATVAIDPSHLQGYDVYTAGITAISVMTNYEHSPIIIPVTAVYTRCWESYLPLLFKDYSPD